MGARFLSNPHFHMEIVKIDGYYKAFCQNRWVQLDISQNRWVQLHPLTRSNEGPVLQSNIHDESGNICTRRFENLTSPLGGA